MFKRNKTDASLPATVSPAKPTPLPKNATPSVISADMNVLGNIVADGMLDIDGKIQGNVRCHTATIRSNGRVKGDVVAETVQIYGEVEGLVKARVVNLYNSARVIGVIMHESLSIEDGAFVDGKFKRTDKVFVEDEPEEDDPYADDKFNMLDNLRLISG